MINTMGSDKMFDFNVYGFGSYLGRYLEYHRISQSDFAERLGITKKHMNSIINNKCEISVDLMLAISLLTDIDVNLIFGMEEEKKVHKYLKEKFKTEKEVNNYLKRFHIKELQEKNWLSFKDITSPVQNTIDLLEYLNIRNLDVLNEYNNKKILYKKKDDADNIKIALWIAHCDKLIKNQKVGEYNKENLSKLLKELKTIRKEKFNEEKLVKTFNKYGIYLVIEEALKGTKIRGCTSVKIKTPAIYMTKLYKDKASFYFALYHELGHVKSDYNMAKSKIIIDLLEDLEKRADAFALNQMIPNKIWEEIKNNPQNIESICKENDIPVSFATTRLAKEKIITYNSKLYNKYKESI